MVLAKPITKKIDISKMSIKKYYVKQTEEQKLERKNKNLKCDCCGVIFKSLYWLNLHINRDNIEKAKIQKIADKIIKFSCNCCNKNWNDKYKLNRHLQSKMITKEKRAVRCDKSIYICSICNLKNASNYNLNRHLSSCNKKNNKNKQQAELIKKQEDLTENTPTDN